MFVYNILIMEKPIKINIDNNPYYSNKKEIEQVNEILAKKTKEFNEHFFKEHCISNSLLKEKGRLILIPNPNLDNSWLENFKNSLLSFGKAGEVDTCNGKDFDFFFEYFIKLTDSEIAIDNAFKKLQEIKEKTTKHKKSCVKSHLVFCCAALPCKASRYIHHWRDLITERSLHLQATNGNLPRIYL